MLAMKKKMRYIGRRKQPYCTTMALHIQMSDEALKQLRRAALMNKLISFGACAGFLLLFGGILYFTILIIASEQPAEFIAYQAPSSDGPPSSNPVSRELSARTATTNPTVTPSVIVAQNAVGAVAAPVSLDTTGELSFDQMDVSVNLDTSLGEGLGSDGGGMGQGGGDGSSLKGEYYDLKLTKSGAPSSLTKGISSKVKNSKTNKMEVVVNTNSTAFRQRAAEKLHEFFTRNNQRALAGFYKAPQSLYNPHFCLPSIEAYVAPKSFGVADVCKPSGLVVVYHGRVRAPKSGKLRFVGMGDDFLGVRFNKEPVLEAGYMLPSLWKKDSDSYEVNSFTNDPDRLKNHWRAVKEHKLPAFDGYEQDPSYRNLSVWNEGVGGLTLGKVFEVKEGEVYPIQVIVAEIPGGQFGFVLLIEDVTNGPGKKGDPKRYDLFRTNFAVPTVESLRKALKDSGIAMPQSTADQMPSFNEDSPIWTVVDVD